MYSENQQIIYCADDNEYGVYCEICDKLCNERYNKNHFKSQTLLVTTIKKISNKIITIKQNNFYQIPEVLIDLCHINTIFNRKCLCVKLN